MKDTPSDAPFARRGTRFTPIAYRLSAIALVAFAAMAIAGCTGPTLRALNPREAKIDVYPSGEVRVYGEPIALRDLESTVRRSSTRPQDTILIRLHGDPEGPELSRMRRLVTDQMIRANHYKFNFFSTPLATVQTYDPVTKRTETFAEDVDLGEASTERAVADVQRLMDETEAYREGTYVSPVVQAKPVAISVGDKPEELKVGGELLEEAKAPAAAKPAVKPTAAKPAQPSQADLREQWKRQQRRNGGAGR
ncbi:MAG: hypothetical protein ACI4W7_07225 [Candidatus Spyradenecus sp.]